MARKQRHLPECARDMHHPCSPPLDLKGDDCHLLLAAAPTPGLAAPAGEWASNTRLTHLINNESINFYEYWFLTTEYETTVFYNPVYYTCLVVYMQNGGRRSWFAQSNGTIAFADVETQVNVRENLRNGTPFQLYRKTKSKGLFIELNQICHIENTSCKCWAKQK